LGPAGHDLQSPDLVFRFRGSRRMDRYRGLRDRDDVGRMMKSTRWTLVSLVVLAAVAPSCGSDHETGCTPGRSEACACSDGRSGAQVCLPDRTFGACSCTGGDGGSPLDGGAVLVDAAMSDAPLADAAGVDARVEVD